jgi:O-antigen/teichoic acid export membrane protein
MSSNRIIINTAATYVRSVFVLVLALFSSRWVLGALGASDFGLFAVVGSIIGFITFLNTVMSASAARHFAFAIGRGDSAEVNKWFNSSLSIHIILSVVLISLGWPIGEYCIHHVFTVPVDRLPACLWVFRLSLIAAFAGMVSIPYIAMFSAKQHIAEIAVWGILSSVLSFTFAFLLTKASGDRMLYYAVYCVTISVLFNIVQIIRARHIFQECRTHYSHWFDKSSFRDILSFASWNLIGSFGSILSSQGSVILLNLYFGPKVNAAFGIANQVCVQTNQLGAAMIGAFAPEITATEGRGDRVRMLSLAHQASKIGTILVLLFAIPLIIEMDYVLKLWLRDPPPYTALFCMLILVALILDRLSAGITVAVSAVGKIAAYQATLGTCLILTLPLAWLFLKLGAPPTSVSLASIITVAIVSVGRVFWARRLLGAPIRRWLTGVVIPSSMVTLIAVVVSMVPRWLLVPSFSRLVIVSLTGSATILLTAWYLAFSVNERGLVKQIAGRLLDKMGREALT